MKIGSGIKKSYCKNKKGELFLKHSVVHTQVEVLYVLRYLNIFVGQGYNSHYLDITLIFLNSFNLVLM